MTKAAYSYPQDEFDAPPDPDAPRGVHRAPRTAWSRWWPFLAVIVIVPLLAWGTVTVLAQRGRLTDLTGSTGSSSAPAQSTSPSATASGAAPTSASPSQAPTSAAPGVNKGVTLNVLNGSKVAGLAKKVGDQLLAAGFTTVKTGNATATTPAASTVFYASDSLKATADLVAQTIKVSTVVLSPADAGTGITVVLRSDPGA